MTSAAFTSGPDSTPPASTQTGSTQAESRCRPKVVVAMDAHSFDMAFDASRRERLTELAEVVGPLPWPGLSAASLPEVDLAEVGALLTCWGAPCLDGALLDRLPQLQAVFHAAGSVRTLVTEESWRRGIQVTSAADQNAEPVAEFTLAAIIMAGKRAPFLANRLTAAEVPDAAGEREALLGRGVSGDLSNHHRSIGIIGLSRIGRRVLQMLSVLAPGPVYVSDPYADAEEVAALGRAGGVRAELVDLPTMLSRVDIVSVHAPELPSTFRMLGRAELALLPDGATVINTARGSLIDTDALLAECSSGRLYAILDVTDPEPLPSESALWREPNIWLTPHLAGSLGTEVHRLADAALDELGRWVAGQDLMAPVSRTEADRMA